MTAFNVALSCRVQDEKVLLITNTTGGPIAAGTPISYDAIRKPDGVHYGRTFQTSTLLPGASVQIGAVPSFSYMAWFRRAPVIAPPRY